MRKKDAPIQQLDIADMVAEACQRVNQLSAEYQAKIIVPESWPTALGYGLWVEEVWGNYISNAIKYGGTPPYLELGPNQ